MNPSTIIMLVCLAIAVVLVGHWIFLHVVGPVRYAEKIYFLFRGRFVVESRMDGGHEWEHFCQIPKVWNPDHAIRIAEQAHLRAMVGTPDIICDTRLVDLLSGRVTRIWTDAVIRRMYERLNNSI